jgi:hypothetical protein
MSNTTNTVTSLNGHFKEVYASKIVDLIPDGVKLYNMIKFVGAEKQLGRFYHQPVILGLEHGFTYTGSAGDLVDLNSAVASANEDAQVRGHGLILRSRITYDAASRSQSSKGAFISETKLLVENMLKSTVRRLEIQMMYGQSGLAVVESVSGAIISIEKEEWAPGVWTGGENMPIDIYTAAGVKRGSASVTLVDMDNRAITVDAVPAGVVATDVIYHLGAYGKEFAGLHKIITNTGSLFNISAATYSLWKGNTVNVGSDFAGNEAVLSFAKVEEGIARAVEKGLADEDVCVICNPRSWKNLLTEQDAKRIYDTSYSSMKSVNGSKNIEFYGANGMIEVISSIYCKEGFAYIIPKAEFIRIGSSDVTFNRPGFDGQFFKELENSNGFEIRCYTDQALFTHKPGHCVLLTYIKS